MCNILFWSLLPLAPALGSQDAIALSMAPLHSLGQDYENEVQHDFMVMWHHWDQYQCNMIPLHSLGQDDLNEVQHDSFSPVMPLAPM